MKADLLIGLDADGGGFTLGFRVLGAEFVGKHFSGQFRAARLHSYLVDWGMWPLAEGKMREALEAAEALGKDRQGKLGNDHPPGH